MEYSSSQMPRPSPTLEGFRVLFRLPSLGLAEIAWRWALGAAFLASFAFATLQYLNSLPVSAADMLMLRTRHPLIVSRAIAHILAGSASRFAAAMIVMAMTLGFAWIVVAAVGRAVTLKSLVIYFFPDRNLPLPIGPLIGLNGFRAAVALASVVASFGGLLLAGAVSSKNDPSPGSAMLIFLALGLFVWLFCAMLNWLLSLAAVFAIDGGLVHWRHRRGGRSSAPASGRDCGREYLVWSRPRRCLCGCKFDGGISARLHRASAGWNCAGRGHPNYTNLFCDCGFSLRGSAGGLSVYRRKSGSSRD